VSKSILRLVSPNFTSIKKEIPCCAKKGLVVIGGCSHPGIVSMTRKAMNISGVNKVYAIIGGFHLIDADGQRIKNTIDAIKEMDIEKIYTGHCTGLKAEAMLLEEFKDKFNKLHSGKIITL